MAGPDIEGLTLHRLLQLHYHATHALILSTHALLLELHPSTYANKFHHLHLHQCLGKLVDPSRSLGNLVAQILEPQLVRLPERIQSMLCLALLIPLDRSPEKANQADVQGFEKAPHLIRLIRRHL